MATRVITISVAAAKVKKNRPPMRGPRDAASDSVASPKSPAKGMRASPEVRKTHRGGTCRRYSTKLTGTKTSSRYMVKPFSSTGFKKAETRATKRQGPRSAKHHGDSTSL